MTPQELKNMERILLDEESQNIPLLRSIGLRLISELTETHHALRSSLTILGSLNFNGLPARQALPELWTALYVLGEALKKP